MYELELTTILNARSLFPKFKIEFLLQVELCHPDVVCIVESRLSPEIQDSEILLPRYQSVRLDRSRHGGDASHVCH